MGSQEGAPCGATARDALDHLRIPSVRDMDFNSTRLLGPFPGMTEYIRKPLVLAEHKNHPTVNIRNIPIILKSEETKEESGAGKKTNKTNVALVEKELVMNIPIKLEVGEDLKSVRNGLSVTDKTVYDLQTEVNRILADKSLRMGYEKIKNPRELRFQKDSEKDNLKDKDTKNMKLINQMKLELQTPTQSSGTARKSMAAATPASAVKAATPAIAASQATEMKGRVCPVHGRQVSALPGREPGRTERPMSLVDELAAPSLLKKNKLISGLNLETKTKGRNVQKPWQTSRPLLLMKTDANTDEKSAFPPEVTPGGPSLRRQGSLRYPLGERSLVPEYFQTKALGFTSREREENNLLPSRDSATPSPPSVSPGSCPGGILKVGTKDGRKGSSRKQVEFLSNHAGEVETNIRYI